MSTFEKYIYKSHVAVIYSPNGEESSSWATSNLLDVIPQEQRCTDRRLVEWFLNGTVPRSLDEIEIDINNVENFKNKVFEFLNIETQNFIELYYLHITWVPVGQRIFISSDSENGGEYITYITPEFGFTA